MPAPLRIAFTSCMRREAFPDQPQWADIDREDPDYLFLLGDQIYMDYGLITLEPNGLPRLYSDARFRRIMDEKYRRQWEEPNFRALFRRMKQRNAVFGVWDDHDFAWNNCHGAKVPQGKKDIARELFHKWMNCSTNLPEIYCSVDLPGARAIFLDNRYYAEAPGPQAKLLGEAQFEFLRQKLDHDHPYTLICGGITLTHGQEKWTRYPAEYARLRQLVEGRKGVIFLAGDIHQNRFDKPGPERPCYEVVASGLAVNYFGLGLPLDDCHNWGLLELNGKGVRVSLTSRQGRQIHHISNDAWFG